MTDYIHKQFPKTVGRQEFWKQIKRTVNGEAVSEDDIDLIISSIKQKLELNSKDTLLDMGCGNAALASYLYKDVKSYHGVDFSDYLLEIAKEHFFIDSKTSFQSIDLKDGASNISAPTSFTKVLIYGVISYLSSVQVSSLTKLIYQDMPNVEAIYIGNIANARYANEFFNRRNIKDFVLDDPNSQIGLWWKPEEFCDVLKENGFSPTVIVMPPDFYGSPYRFDIVGKRNG